MKTILTIMTVLGLAAGVAFAGCGKKTTDAGSLKKYDADSKSIVVKTEDGQAKVTLTASTAIKDKDGKDAKIEDLVGKSVKVVSEHKKADSVTETS